MNPTVIRPLAWLFLSIVGATLPLRAEVDFDAQGLEQQARPAVVLLIIADANKKPFAIGTGFFVSPDGKIITNRHVVEGAVNVMAKTENGTLYPVTGVLAIHPKADIALLQSVGHDVPFLEISPSAYEPLGSKILVIGNPLGKEGTTSEGTLVSRGDWVRGEKMTLNVEVSPGSSGSPVLNARGEAIGVIVEQSLDGVQLSFALPGELPRALLAENGEGSGTQVQPFAEIEWGEAYKVKFDPDYQQATKELSDHNFQAAQGLLEAVVKRFPDNLEAWQRLGVVYSRLKLEDQCQAALRQVTLIDPHNAVSWVNLGRSYLLNHKVDQGIAASEEALKWEPDFYEAYLGLGVGYAEKGDMGQSVEELERATQIRPEEPTAWRVLARVYIAKQQFQQAADAYEKVVEIDPNDKETWEYLVKLDKQLQRADRLWEAEHRLKELGP